MPEAALIVNPVVVGDAEIVIGEPVNEDRATDTQ
jgi:hypothetical protein